MRSSNLKPSRIPAVDACFGDRAVRVPAADSATRFPSRPVRPAAAAWSKRLAQSWRQLAAVTTQSTSGAPSPTVQLSNVPSNALGPPAASKMIFHTKTVLSGEGEATAEKQKKQANRVSIKTKFAPARRCSLSACAFFEALDVFFFRAPLYDCQARSSSASTAYLLLQRHGSVTRDLGGRQLQQRGGIGA